jgi:hypothetical protein
VTDLHQEQRAYDLLQWVPYSLPGFFDDDLAVIGQYTEVQTQKSDAALKAWDDDHPFVSSSELMAFKELERLGVYSDSDFYSPSKAKDSAYSEQLKRRAAPRVIDSSSPPRRESDSGGEGTGLDASHAKQVFRARRPRRRTRS